MPTAVAYRVPGLSPELLWRSPGGTSSLPFPLALGPDRVRRYGLARTALLDALLICGLQDGDEVLLPDYICHVIMGPLNALGLRPLFYPVSATLTPDLESAAAMASSRTKALIAVNYFGFPFPHDAFRRFCDARRIWLVEDNAHGFLSADGDAPLGTMGDVSLFSLRKTIPLLNGALLLVNHRALLERLAEIRRNPRRQRGRARWAAVGTLKWATESTNVPLMRLLGGRVGNVDDSEDVDDPGYSFDPTAHWVLRRWPFAREVRRRRDNYARLQAAARCRDDIAPAFDGLPDGICPQVFAASVEDQRAWLEFGARCGAAVYAWPTLPEVIRRRGCAPRDRLVLFPVTRDVSAILEAGPVAPGVPIGARQEIRR